MWVSISPLWKLSMIFTERMSNLWRVAQDSRWAQCQRAVSARLLPQCLRTASHAFIKKYKFKTLLPIYTMKRTIRKVKYKVHPCIYDKNPLVFSGVSPPISCSLHAPAWTPTEGVIQGFSTDDTPLKAMWIPACWEGGIQDLPWQCPLSNRASMGIFWERHDKPCHNLGWQRPRTHQAAGASEGSMCCLPGSACVTEPQKSSSKHKTAVFSPKLLHLK